MRICNDQSASFYFILFWGVGGWWGEREWWWGYSGRFRQCGMARAPSLFLVRLLSGGIGQVQLMKICHSTTEWDLWALEQRLASYLGAVTESIGLATSQEGSPCEHSRGPMMTLISMYIIMGGGFFLVFPACAFFLFFFLKWRGRTHQFHSLGQDQSTVSQ